MKIFKMIFILILVLYPIRIFAENIDPDNDNSQYAWGENVGWLNLEPGGDGGPGVEVGDYEITGYIWGENIGWINLSPSTGGGVNNDGAGNLTGHAWGENVGWINFAPVGGGVTINLLTGEFAGYAWGENVGWINFAPDGVAVKTSWPSVSDIDGDGIPDANDNCLNTPTDEVVDENGCGISQLCPCESLWKNHAAYVNCVAHTSNTFVSDGLITEEQKDEIVSSAAESECGHKK